MTAPRISADRTPTGISGFDAVSQGGIPAGRTTLVVGSAGSGKTVFGAQFLVAGACDFGEPGVMVTFDESAGSLIRNVRSFGWDVTQMIEDRRLAIVDCSPDPMEEIAELGDYNLLALLARIRAAAERIGARRVTLDSVNALMPQFLDAEQVRRELTRVIHGLNEMGVTTMITAERTDEYGALGRHGVEEFVADAVVVLRNPLDEQRRRRLIEVVKLRGGSHLKGEFPFTIASHEGISVIPLASVELDKPASARRISLGNDGIDRLFGGGVYGDSLILVSGPTGTGKTLMSLGFIQAAVVAGERAVLFSFEESHNQLLRNASSWSQDLAAAERDGLVKILSVYPERMSLEDLLMSIRDEIVSFAPQRVALDSLTALERVSSQRSFREFVVRVTTLFKSHEIAGLFTNTSSMISGGETVTDAYVSTITDGILLLRYAEIEGEMRRGATVLKMRGSMHERTIREFTITDSGMVVGDVLPASRIVLHAGDARSALEGH